MRDSLRQNRRWFHVPIVCGCLSGEAAPSAAVENLITFECKGTGTNTYPFSGSNPEKITFTAMLTIDLEARVYAWKDTLPPPGGAGREKIAQIHGEKITLKKARGKWAKASYAERSELDRSDGSYKWFMRSHDGVFERTGTCVEQ